MFNINKKIFKGLDFYINHKPTEYCINPPKTRLKAQDRIIVIGDLHGDYQAMLHALYKATVINNKGEWIGGKTFVVQLGDQLDKGGRGVELYNSGDTLEELKIIEFMHHLNDEAVKHDGAVYNLIGNHELMNIIGDFRYVSQTHMDEFRGQSVRRELFKPGGALAHKLACNTCGILQIGGWIFVHAGLLPEHASKYTIDDINIIVRDILLGKISILDLSGDIHELIFGKNSLFWNRHYSLDTNKDSCDTLNKTLEILDVGSTGGMVVGHTIKPTITGACNNRLWMADVGMSSAFGNQNKKIEILEIIDNGRIVRKI